MNSWKAGLLRGNAMQQQNSASGGAELRINAASCSDTGRLRTHNEDAILIYEPLDQAVSARFGWLYLLADGAGGHAAGEVASRLAVETITAAYYAQQTSRHATENAPYSQGKVNHLQGPLRDLETPIEQLQRAFFAAHTRIREVAHLKQEYTGMITTCIAAVIKGAQLLIAHVGDSRAYLIRPSSASKPSITRLTTDHSMVTELARAGIISPEQMHSSPSRHIILRALGEKDQGSPGPDITTCVVQAGDAVLLCCDGLWSMLTEEQIALVVSRATPQVACAELIRLANEAGGEDNISAVVLSFM
ncbi:MAG TPA: protein phosphatase 2C domain-containing protein [Ktedonobacteraceae bacterium]|nr:protein phosphatase 2C domain-containing protein [Ktedonobacteraceae bacterium]